MGGAVYRYSCPYRYTRLFLESTSESAEDSWKERIFLINTADTCESAEDSWKETILLINTADTCEIDYTLVPSTKGNSDLWKHLNQLVKQKTDSQTDADVPVCR